MFFQKWLPKKFIYAFARCYAALVPTRKKRHGSGSCDLFCLWRRCLRCLDLSAVVCQVQQQKLRCVGRLAHGKAPENDLRALLGENPRPATRELAEGLNVDHSTVISPVRKREGSIKPADGFLTNCPRKTWKTVKVPMLQGSLRKQYPDLARNLYPIRHGA